MDVISSELRFTLYSKFSGLQVSTNLYSLHCCWAINKMDMPLIKKYNYICITKKSRIAIELNDENNGTSRCQAWTRLASAIHPIQSDPIWSNFICDTTQVKQLHIHKVQQCEQWKRVIYIKCQQGTKAGTGQPYSEGRFPLTEFTARVHGCQKCTRVLGPSTRPVNSGRELG